ncbi:MAG: bis(5'-nucleosyl)-tetraphosphatase [Poseidonia sp.]
METSCGVVLVNYGAVLLLQYPQGHWDLPKGHVEENDNDRTATMLRELAEETGIADVSVLDGFEERTEYTFRHKGKRKNKEVYWYVAETDTMEVELSHEHRGYLWLDWDQALETITHDETRSVVRLAQQFVKLYGTQ